MPYPTKFDKLCIYGAGLISGASLIGLLFSDVIQTERQAWLLAAILILMGMMLTFWLRIRAQRRTYLDALAANRKRPPSP